MIAVDLFCGMGGLSLGFAQEGFEVTGLDVADSCRQTFELNGLGNFFQVNLRRKSVDLDCDLLLGGPPCKPWSNLNVTRRGKTHPDYDLLRTFFANVRKLAPQIFLMENVIHLKSDLVFQRAARKCERAGYSVGSRVVRYCDWGAASARHRLLVIGIKNAVGTAESLFQKLETSKRPPQTTRLAISRFESTPSGGFPDHVWPTLHTISKYERYYKTGKYGWYHLSYDRPAPSFGNVMKTYTLHPLAGLNGFPLRVISVRESMAIMGFPEDFVFPEGLGMRLRYQMVADAVSPLFSRICAKIAGSMLK